MNGASERALVLRLTFFVPCVDVTYTLLTYSAGARKTAKRNNCLAQFTNCIISQPPAMCNQMNHSNEINTKTHFFGITQFRYWHFL